MAILSYETLRALPKVLLHDHLDGGVRPQTLIELADETGYTELPTKDPDALRQWFARGADRGSLPLYLEGFRHTTALMQSPEALERVAYEMLEDMASDGVVYVETRFAPVFHTGSGLNLEEVVTAVLRGLTRGRQDFGVEFGLILCAMRHLTDSLETAELAIDFANRGVVGLDLAGEEAGHPPKRHLDAFHAIQRANFNITIHAGEAFGIESIWQAVQYCGAHRLGHATRLIEDMTVVDGKAIKLGPLAQYVLDKRIPLEMCLSSNVHTGAVPSLDQHPFRIYCDRNYRVTLNTDNRLMSDTTLTREYQIAVEKFGVNLNQLEKITTNGMKSAFAHFDDRIRLIFGIIKPGFARVVESLS
ncbi:MAG: adenosine deaminase [Planctomycetota bacterium]